MHILKHRTHSIPWRTAFQTHRNDIEKLLSLEKLINIFLQEQIGAQKAKKTTARMVFEMMR